MDEVFNALQASAAPSVEQKQVETFGQYLRRNRMARHVSIEELSWGTKIKPEYLLALESGDYSGLPGETFTKGYLKSYAQYVGMDPQEVVTRYVQCGHEPCVMMMSESTVPEKFSVLSWLFVWLDRFKQLLTGRDDEQVY